MTAHGISDSASQRSSETGSGVSDEVQMEFSEQAASLLCELAYRTQRDVGQVISDALSVYDWVEKQHEMGLNVVGTNESGQAVNKIRLPENKQLPDTQQRIGVDPVLSKKPKFLARFLRKAAS
ncbi:MAG: hypothetical protein AAFR58_09495 [Cyanobacteria bacterium J06627_28]